MPNSLLTGYVERVTRNEVSGWVYDGGDHTKRVGISIIFRGSVVATCMADLERPDLSILHLTDTNHGFSVQVDGVFVKDLSDIEVQCIDSKFQIPILDTAGALEGVVENDSYAYYSGWGWQVGSPTTKVGVDLLIDGISVATSVADHFRGDLLEADIGDGNHGFVLHIPPEHRNPESRNRARIAFYGTDIDLMDRTGRGSASHLSVFKTNTADTSSVIDANQYGTIEYRSGIISGWVREAGNELPVNIDVEIDGDLLWSGPAKRLAETGKGLQAFGFRLQLPPPLKTVASRELVIKDQKGNFLLNTPATLPYGDEYIGHVEEVVASDSLSLVVKGWCINMLAVSAPVLIRVFDKDAEIAVFFTQSKREDLSATGFDAPFAAFSHEILLKEPIESVETLSFIPGHSTRPLEKRITVKPGAEPAMAPKALAVSNDDDVVDGTIDEVSERFIRGWARNRNNSDALVVLDCFIDDRLYATTAATRFRADLAKHFGDHGFHQYLFEMTPALEAAWPGAVRIAPRVGKNEIKQKFKSLRKETARSKIILPREAAPLSRYCVSSKGLSDLRPTVGIIIINRNGHDLLKEFFESFAHHNTYSPVELIVVDHASTDPSAELCAQWKEKLNLVWLPRDGNYSFSASNNYGVERTNAEIVIFANNDLSFTGDIIGDVVASMEDPEVGCVGIKLFDDTPYATRTSEPAVQHLGVHFQNPVREFAVEAYESRFAPVWGDAETRPTEVPVVTGAFTVCRRDEFTQLGGFSEDYFYGYEDVDLCLMYQAIGKKVISLNNVGALHLRGFSREKMNATFNAARQRNREVLDQRFAVWLKRRIAEERFSRPAFWTGKLPRIAFAVTEANEGTLAGDYFTALELASQIAAAFPCECIFVETLKKTEYTLPNCDVVIAMRDDYDPLKIAVAPPHIIKVAWVRNWFERFAERPNSRYFDCIWASSKTACDYLSEKLGKNVLHLPIATNLYRFQAGKFTPEFASDYCFTGSYWGLNREIVQMLDPAALPFNFALFGTGWDKIERLAPFAKGSLPYKRMPDVYASTRLVIDDANHVTKAWGAVNSRVYDAIAAGALVVTNGASGSASEFDGLLPVYNSPQELEDLLWRYLDNEEERLAKVAELQAHLKKHHTYQSRAKKVMATLTQSSASQLRIAIKIGAPNRKVLNEWGDYHFALSMKWYMDLLGHTVSIDTLDDWYCPRSLGDDVVIVLRGLSTYKPRASQINLMWNISHPDTISEAEYNSYDHVFVASEPYARRLSAQIETPVSALLQCTDPRLFHPDVPRITPAPEVLFVGNSRNVFRQVVRDAIAVDLPLKVYGTRWSGYIADEYLKGENIPNCELASYYASAGVVLNDHWANMARYGFISNRLFDLVACGGRGISDQVEGIAEIFGDAVHIYSGAEDLGEKCTSIMSAPRESFLAASEGVRREHTFPRRIEVILFTAKTISEERHP